MGFRIISRGVEVEEDHLSHFDVHYIPEQKLWCVSAQSKSGMISIAEWRGYEGDEAEYFHYRIDAVEQAMEYARASGVRKILIESKDGLITKWRIIR